MQQEICWYDWGMRRIMIGKFIKSTIVNTEGYRTLSHGLEFVWVFLIQNKQYYSTFETLCF